MIIKALSLLQPYATLIAIGAKEFETRSWRAPHRGALAIHASKKLGNLEYDLCHQEPFRSVLAAAGYETPTMLELGCVVAIVDVVNIRDTQRLADSISEQERAFGDWTPGRCAWQLSNVRRLATPVPATGALGLWDWTVPKELVGLVNGTARPSA